MALRRAQVTVAQPGGTTGSVFTDDDGRYAVAVPAGTEVEIAAARAGYATATSRATFEQNATLNIRLPRGAVLSGRVVDASGVPMIAAPVVARREDPAAAKDVNGPAFFVATTDDFGEFRLGGLPAGRYVMSAATPPSPLTFVVPAGETAVASRPGQTAPPPPPPPPSPRALSTAVVVRPQNPLAPRPPRTDAEAAAAVDLRPGDDVRGLEVVVPAPMSTADIRRFAYERLREIAADLGRPAPADTRCPGGASMRGRVSLTSGEPLGGVTVRLTRFPRAIATAVTGADGTYSLECLLAGEYTLEAARYGHVLSQRLPSAVRVSDGEAVAGPAIRFERGGALTGGVRDEHGEPMQGVRVRALQVRYAAGRNSAAPSGSEVRTDDRGHFRIFGLAPGSYLLAATVDASLPASGRPQDLGYAPLYYPGTSSLESALPLQVEPGLDLTGLNMVFRPAIAARVSGVAIDASGQPFEGSAALAVSVRSGRIAPEPAVFPIAAGGAFTIPNVPPGDYVLHVMKAPRFGSAEYASEYVTVTDRDPPPLLVQTSPGSTLEGRIAIRGAMPGDLQVHQFSVAAHPVDPDRAPFPGRKTVFSTRSVGEFYAIGLIGPQRVVLESAPPGWYLQSVTIDGTDVTDTGADLARVGTRRGAEIVLSTRGATIAGRTQDARGDPVAAAVVVFPVQRTLWVPYSRHTKRGDAREDGTFEIVGLPPGEYWVAAVNEAEEPGDWPDPALLDALASRAERVTVAESERVSVVVRLRR